MYVCMHIYAWTRDLWVWTRDLWYGPDISGVDQQEATQKSVLQLDHHVKNVKKDRCKGEE